MNNGMHGIAVLGSVVLCITGCVALYAGDLGISAETPFACPGFLLFSLRCYATISGKGLCCLRIPK